MLEKQIERKVCDHAKAQGMLVYKFSSPNKSAVPDRLFVTRVGTIFFIEFKRGGEEPTPAQKREHERLRGNNAMVYVVDNVDTGKFVIDLMVKL